MDKTLVWHQLKEAMEALLRRHQQANRQASAGATDEQSRAETKWDTSGLEASYLARGHARQFTALALQLDELRAMEPRSFKGQPIGIGALVTLELEGQTEYYFLLRQGGGMDVEVSLGRVTVVTPQSPLGESMYGLSAGESLTLPNGEQASVITVD